MTQTPQFQYIVLDKIGLGAFRYMYSTKIEDEAKREKYNQRTLDNRAYRFIAYKTFINGPYMLWYKTIEILYFPASLIPQLLISSVVEASSIIDLNI